MVEHQGRLTGYTFSHLPVSSSSAQFTGWWGPEQLGKNHVRKGLSKAGVSKYAIIYKIDILHIYSKGRDIYTLHMLYIHLVTVKNMLLRSF